jgi:Tfp pilus assembly protein PilO
MKMKRIVVSSREKWLLAAAGVAVLAYLMMQHYILPYWDSLGTTSEKIEILSKRVTQYRRILKGQDSVKAALETVRRQASSMESGLLNSRADALANAEIQGLVKDLAVSKGMTFRRSDLLPVKPVSPEYSKVSTRVEVLGAINQLVDFLVSFESSQRILFVEEMRISPVQMGNPKNKQVLATLMVSGLKNTDKSVTSKKL